MRERREIFKKQKLPLHDEDSESEDQEIVKENKPSKKLVTNVKLHPRKSSRHHSDRHAENRRRESSVIHKRRKTRQQSEQTSSAKKISKIEERRSFINSKNRLTMGIYNQGKQSHTIYRDPDVSKVFEKMSKKLKDKTKEDMSKVLDCSSFQIKPLQACISETTFGDFSLPDSGSSHHSQNDQTCKVDHDGRQTISSVGSVRINSPTNYSDAVEEISERMDLPSEPRLEDITQRLLNTLQPRETFGKDHLQDIRNELKEYYRKSTLQQEYCDGHILLDASNRPSNTPVRVGKIPIAGKRLFPSSIRRIDHMTRDLENSAQDFSRQNFANCGKSSAKGNVTPFNENLADHCTTQPQSDIIQHDRDTESPRDILSIIDEQCCSDLMEVSKYAIISPLKKPSLDIPSPPDKLLPRKLF